MEKINISKDSTILVTGRNSQLGETFYEKMRFFKNIYFFDRNTLDITSKNDIDVLFKQLRPDIVINTAAYTNVDGAEDDREQSYLTNAKSLDYLADCCARHHALLIHFSTDYVFDGEKKVPYIELDDTNPINYYGETKLLGEMNITKNRCRFLIFRISWLYSKYGKNFHKTISQLICEKDHIDVVSDQIGVPTSADFIVSNITDLIINSRLTEQNCNQIYHLSPHGSASWYEFAVNINNYQNITCNIIPTSSDSYYTKARRPLHSKLSADKFINTFGVDIKNWEFYYKELITNS
jgi:dTDP-4-dehydrorhamnose reductase